MANFLYPSGKMAIVGVAANQGPIDWDADVLRIMLVNQTYRDLIDATKAGHDFRNDVTANEISGTGYTAGGVVLSGASIALSGNSARVDFTVDPSWASSTIASAWGAIVFKQTGGDLTTPADDPLIAFLDFGAAISSTNATFTIQIHANGLYELT